MSAIVFKQCGKASPESILDASLTLYPPGTLLAVQYELDCFWLQSGETQALTAIYELPPAAASGVRYVVAPGSSLEDRLANFDGGIEDLACHLDVECFDSAQPLPLQPVHIPKPWGEEIWYTGMEWRGVARAGQANGAQPLPWVLSALPQRLCGGLQQPLVLLKILAPLPDEVYGDLYFELHREKREVYVVTHVDPQAWPEGKGGIRLGFSEQKRAAYASDDDFRKGFAAAVRHYEPLRREIDARLDREREKHGIGLNDPVAPQQIRDWLAMLPEELRRREEGLRAEMESFTRLIPLQPGDVVKVPTRTPHSLQHGVRVVEFQTPVYERLIVSFAQKVLTQSHWDTDAAVAEMVIDTPPQEGLVTHRKKRDFIEEKVVDFDDFEVFRVVVDSGGSVPMPAPAVYALVMTVQGELELPALRLSPEQAAMIPGGATLKIHNCGPQPLIFLWALPARARRD